MTQVFINGARDDPNILRLRSSSWLLRKRGSRLIVHTVTLP
ncbi:uncharacterized protein Dere_GG10525, isoform B [Drosophila erecta]|uniref:Uncharacterized protein, isoform B n=1 Tax=Drosophila erecta TaxID=7220 RepID=A0A0Q5WN51_DROER|nr:uncharacterized protein Dere_GG10525, isoform B [Drosophila erecta]